MLASGQRVGHVALKEPLPPNTVPGRGDYSAEDGPIPSGGVLSIGPSQAQGISNICLCTDKGRCWLSSLQPSPRIYKVDTFSFQAFFPLLSCLELAPPSPQLLSSAVTYPPHRRLHPAHCG